MTELEMFERIEEQNRQLAQARNSQAGSDRVVMQLKKQLEALTEAAEKDPAPAAPDPQAELKAREEQLSRKERILELATERGIKPDVAYLFAGLTDATDEEKLDALASREADAIANARTEWLAKNGRTPYQSVKLGGRLTADQLDALDPRTLGGFSTEVLQSALNEAEPSGKRPTLRERISRDLRGE